MSLTADSKRSRIDRRVFCCAVFTALYCGSVHAEQITPVGGDGPISIENQDRWEFVDGAPVQLHGAGGVAGPPPAVVFSNSIHPAGLYDPVGDLSDGFLFFRIGSSGAGAWNADDWHLGLGQDECSGLSLQVAVFGGGLRCHDAPEFNACAQDSDCSVGACTPSPDFDATIDVFNHDPSIQNDDLFDSNGDCIATDPGVGAFSTTFFDLDGQSAHFLTVDLGGAPVGGPNGAIWVRVQTTTDSAGWILGSNNDTIEDIQDNDDAEIGFTGDFAGANSVLVNQTFCGLYFFGGFPGPQASYWGNLTCDGDASMSLEPAFATGTECAGGAADDPATCDWFIDGPNSIVLHRSGLDVSAEVFVSDWDQQGTGRLISGAQAGVDCGLFDSGKQGSFRPTAAINCGDPALICNWADVDRPDYLFQGISILGGGCADTTCPDGSPGFVRCGAVVLIEGDGAPDPGNSRYLNTFGLVDENDDTRGRFFLGLTTSPGETFLRDELTEPVAPIAHTPMQVTVRTGACCGDPGGPLQCSDNVLFDECAAVGGFFFPDAQCTGSEGSVAGLDAICSDCPPIAPEVLCNDFNDCTQDTCEDGAGCINTDATTPGFCCNPASGFEQPISDGNACTIDECNANTGQVSHSPVAAGTACDDGDSCTAGDQCDAGGTCVGTPGTCGLCCHPNFGALGCDDEVLAADCAALGGAFEADASCAGADQDQDGRDDACPAAVPATSTWGLLILCLLLAAGAKLYRHRAAC